jgi:hypothetical protein
MVESRRLGAQPIALTQRQIPLAKQNRSGKYTAENISVKKTTSPITKNPLNPAKRNISETVVKINTAQDGSQTYETKSNFALAEIATHQADWQELHDSEALDEAYSKGLASPIHNGKKADKLPKAWQDFNKDGGIAGQVKKFQALNKGETLDNAGILGHDFSHNINTDDHGNLVYEPNKRKASVAVAENGMQATKENLKKTDDFHINEAGLKFDLKKGEWVVDSSKQPTEKGSKYRELVEKRATLELAYKTKTTRIETLQSQLKAKKEGLKNEKGDLQVVEKAKLEREARNIELEIKTETEGLEPFNKQFSDIGKQLGETRDSALDIQQPQRERQPVPPANPTTPPATPSTPPVTEGTTPPVTEETTPANPVVTPDPSEGKKTKEKEWYNDLETFFNGKRTEENPAVFGNLTLGGISRSVLALGLGFNVIDFVWNKIFGKKEQPTAADLAFIQAQAGRGR